MESFKRTINHIGQMPLVGFFHFLLLAAINLGITFIFIMLTFTNGVTTNSRFAALIIVVLGAYAISNNTKSFSGLKRVLIFGSSSLLTMFIALLGEGAFSITSGFVPCIIAFLSLLYYANDLRELTK